MGSRARLFVLLSFGLLACSGASDKLDLSAASQNASDATVESSTGDHGDAAVSGDAPAGDEPAPLAQVDASVADVAIPDAMGLDDAAPEAAPSLCSTICQGCCDATGQCHTMNTATLCGKQGQLCDDCSQKSCALTEFGCCKASGECGCAVGGLVGCN